ncbi:MAG: TIGR04141 family sporadically distributed protein [Bacteroidales bacterium]|nr:TIGR04141 family sporadically distributed protein [Bacteroidales bacterium]
MSLQNEAGYFLTITKILSNSTNISHLFEQGLLSISVLEEKDKHKVINEIISEDGGESYRIPDDASAQDYSIIYILLCDSSKIDSDGRPKIPFFSKAVFKEVYEALEAKGVSSSIMAIKKVLKTKSGVVFHRVCPEPSDNPLSQCNI